VDSYGVQGAQRPGGKQVYFSYGGFDRPDRVLQACPWVQGTGRFLVMVTPTYRELGVLAEGGMAIVARAVRDHDGLPVVIKRVRPPLSFDAGYLRLFADEGATHAALDNAHVVRMLDRGEDEQGPYLVFEHVDGSDLGALLDAAIDGDRPLDIEMVLAVAVPLVSALAYVHEAERDGICLDVIHRDVSPGNVLLGDDGAVKLADFGVAASRLKTEQTVAGELKGKFAYMAPEQTRGERATPQTDLFAVGVVLWECLQNRRLWERPTDADIVRAIREEPAPPLPAERVGEDLAELVAALLAKDPAQRPRTARVVVERLRSACVERGLDDGLARIVARAVRVAPRRALTPLPEARRRTQRVVGDAPFGATAPPTRRWTALAVSVASIVPVVSVVAVGTFLARVDGADPASGAANAGGSRTASAASSTLDAPIASSGSPPARPTEHPLKPTTAATPAAKTPTMTATTATTTTATPPGPPRRPGSARAPATTAPSAVEETPRAEGFGRLSVTSEPWARVTIDSVVVAPETPLMGFTVPAGRHTVRLDNPVMGLTKTIVVDVRPDRDERLFVDLTR
jgi:hypothetical protein